MDLMDENRLNWGGAQRLIGGMHHGLGFASHRAAYSCLQRRGAPTPQVPARPRGGCLVLSALYVLIKRRKGMLPAAKPPIPPSVQAAKNKSFKV